MITESFLAVPLYKDKKIIGTLIASNRERPGHLFTKKNVDLMGGLSDNIGIALQNAKLYQNLRDMFISTIKSLVRAIDAKDQYTSGHSERVMEYSLAVAKEMELSEEETENLKLSSLLHDVGKIGIREKVLLKKGALTDKERGQMQEHPAIGKNIVETINDSARIINGIVEHHEKYGGGGYPANLKGNKISLYGRIIAIADVYDALTTKRPYHGKLSGKEAFFEILNGSGTHFDPSVIKAFIRSFSHHPDVWAK
jgi:HD-GYP domain-containing protein (c-di-GMP phosphodiesterase class II)